MNESTHVPAQGIDAFFDILVYAIGLFSIYNAHSLFFEKIFFALVPKVRGVFPIPTGSICVVAAIIAVVHSPSFSSIPLGVPK